MEPHPWGPHFITAPLLPSPQPCQTLMMSKKEDQEGQTGWMALLPEEPLRMLRTQQLRVPRNLQDWGTAGGEFAPTGLAQPHGKPLRLPGRCPGASELCQSCPKLSTPGLFSAQPKAMERQSQHLRLLSVAGEFCSLAGGVEGSCLFSISIRNILVGEKREG